MRAATVFVVLVAMCLVSPPSFAQYISGNALLPFCDEETTTGIVELYIAGVVDGAMTYNSSILQKMCIPEGVQLDQLKQIFCRDLRGMPENWHVSASGIVGLSLSDAFPCR